MSGIDFATVNPWIETVGVVGLSLLGWLAGRACSKLPKPYWMLAYLLPLLIVFLIWLGRANGGLELVPPISWVAAGRMKFALCGFVAAMMLTIPVARVSNLRLRRLVWLFTAIFIGNCCVWPFAASALNHDYLLSCKTRLDQNGVCLQSTDYSCGPAAAVTALRKLGVEAEEGKIAVAAHTSSAMGTPPTILFDTLKEQFGKDGIRCEYRHFKDIAELRQAGLTIAVIKFGPLVDHYITVLEVTDDRVIVGDPLEGKVEYSFDKFQKKWRRLGIVVHRSPPAPTAN